MDRFRVSPTADGREWTPDSKNPGDEESAPCPLCHRSGDISPTMPWGRKRRAGYIDSDSGELTVSHNREIRHRKGERTFAHRSNPDSQTAPSATGAPYLPDLSRQVLEIGFVGGQEGIPHLGTAELPIEET